MAKLKSGTRIYGTATIDTSVVVGSAVTLSSSGIQVTGISTLNNANATQLTVSGVSTFSGIATHTAALFGTQASFSGVTTTATLNVGTGGTVITTTGSGSVGIGTTNPQDKLEINSLNGVDVKLRLSTNVSSFNNFSVIRSVRDSDSQSKLQFQVNNAGIQTAISIDSSGSVTIGEQSSTKLIVTGNSTDQPSISAPMSILNIYSNTSYAANTGGSITLGGAYWSLSPILNKPFGVIKGYKENATDQDSKGYLSFLTNNGSDTVEALRVNSSGNLGIGTTNPQYPLQVQGNARVTGAVYDSTNSPGTTGQVLQSTVSGTQWTTAAAGGGGSGKFDTTIDNVLYVQPTGTLDIVGVGTTTTQITTLPGGSNKYLVHSLHVTNISNGDAEITAGFVMNAKKVPATISVSIGQSGGPGIHTFTVGSASSITVGMAVTGTGNIGETTGIGSTAGFQFNTYVTSVNGTTITLSKPMSGYATGTLFFSPVSKVSSRLPVPVGSAVELLKQPMVLAGLDSIVLQSTGAGSGIGSTSTNAISQTVNSNFLTVTAGAAITNFLASGMLIQPTGSNTGIQTNTFVGVGYTPGTLSIPMTRPATVSLASTSLSFTEVVVPQDGALQVTVVYQSSTDTSYQNGTGTVVAISSNTTSVTAGLSTIPVAYYSTGIVYPSIIQSIRVSKIYWFNFFK